VERCRRDSAQTHIVFGTDVPGHAHPDRYALVLISAALGAGMSSRLFQRVREELALCYSVYTYQSFYSRSRVSGVYVGTRPATAAKAAAAVREELAKVAAEGLPAAELEQVKRQVKGQIVLSLESSGARLHRLATFALHDEPLTSLSELLAKIDAVGAGDVLRVAPEAFGPDRQLELRLGPP
jgi:predicted Zn-dependent peptidase